MNKLIKWFAINAGFGLALYFGLVLGVDGAARLAQFWVWFAFVASWGVMSDDVVRKVQEAGGPAVPIWVNVLTDIAAIVVLVWFGWVWSAVAYLVHTVFQSRCYQPLRPRPTQASAP